MTNINEITNMNERLNSRFKKFGLSGICSFIFFKILASVRFNYTLLNI